MEPGKKARGHKRDYIGKIVGGKFVPNKKYLHQQQVEKKEESTKPGPVPAVECRRLFYGASYLLEQISEKTSISDDLKSCFGGAAGEILSIAYDLVIEEGQPMWRFPR